MSGKITVIASSMNTMEYSNVTVACSDMRWFTTLQLEQTSSASTMHAVDLVAIDLVRIDLVKGSLADILALISLE